MTVKLIYICEDDPHLGLVTQALLKEEGYDCQLFVDSEALDKQCRQRLPDVLLLDNGLPGESGFDIAKRYEIAEPNIRIIMMSVLQKAHHLSQGYCAGAMLYLPKPFDPEALIACLKGLFKDRSLQYRLTLKTQYRQLLYPEGVVDLTTNETKILYCLSLHYPRVVEYFELMETLGLDLDFNQKNALEMMVSRLRKKLKYIPHNMLIISNKQSLGYSITDVVNVV
jgi:two-component system OmpR family response regulator